MSFFSSTRKAAAAVMGVALGVLVGVSSAVADVGVCPDVIPGQGYPNPPAVNATYGQSLSEIASQLASPPPGACNVFSGEFVWEDAGNTRVGDVSGSPYTLTVTYTPSKDEEEAEGWSVETGIDVTVNVEPKNPTADDLTFSLASATYNGSEQGITAPTVKSPLTGLGTVTVKYYQNGSAVSPKNAGDYTVKVAIAAGTNFNATSTDIELGTYTIDQATGTAPTSWPTASDITYGATLSTSTLSGGDDSKGSFAWTDGTIIPTVNNSGYSVTFKPTDEDNYDWDGVTLTHTVDVDVSPALVAKPTVTGGPLTYDGEAQSPTIAEDAAYTISGNSQTAANTYRATVELNDKSNYAWNDGSGSAAGTDNLSLEWTIGKATPSDGNLTFDETNVDYDGEVHTVTVKAVSPMEGLGTPTVKYFDKDNSPVSDGPKNAGAYTVSVELAEGTNFEASGSAIELTETFTINQATLTANDLVFDLTAKTYAADVNLGIAEPTLKDGKTGLGTVTVKYYDKDNTDVAESALKAGTYTVKVNVTAGDNFALINGLELGSYVINKGTIEFSSHDPISTTYRSGLTLQDLTSELETGYSWKVPATELNAGDNQSFDATYTDPEGNYEDANGSITVNVAKALVTKPTVTSSDVTYEGIELSATITGDTKYEITGDKATNAGTYTATVALVDKSNYSWDDGDGNDDGTADLKLTWKINKGTPNDVCVTFTPKSATYNGEEHTVAVALVDGLTGLGTVTVKYIHEGDAKSPVNAGVYTVTVDIAEGDNFEAAADLELGELTIKKATPEVTEWPTASAIEYGEALSQSTLSGGAANVAGEFAWTNPTTKPTVVNSGYQVTFTPDNGSDANYDWTGFAATATHTVAITVNPTPTNIPSTTTISATYGETLGDYLPTAFAAGNGACEDAEDCTVGSYSWTAGNSTSVGDVAGSPRVFELVFTPTDENYATVKQNVSVTVSPKSLSGATVAVAAGTYTYNGSAQEPTVTVTLAGSTVAEENYSVGYSANTNAGTATVTVTGTGNYNGTASETFSIGKATPSNSNVTFTPASADYDGETHVVAVALVDGDLTGLGDVTSVKYLVDDAEATPKNAGSYTVKVDIAEGINFEEATDLELGALTIKKATPEVTEWPTASAIDYGQELSASVLSGGDANVKGTFAWTSPTTKPAAGSAGTYEVTFTPNNPTDANYDWDGFVKTHNVGITVNPAVTNIPAFASLNLSATYGDKLNSILPTAIDAGNTDGYTPGSYSWVGADASTEVGDAGNQTHTLKFTPTDPNYESKSAEVIVAVAPKSLSGATVAVTGGPFTYNGSAQEPAVTVTLDGSLDKDVDYTVSYTDNTNAGTATVTVTGTGNYKESASETFSIAPATLTVTADSWTIMEGDDEDLVLTYTVTKTELQGTDDESVITAKPMVKLADDADISTAGEYDIEITGGATNGNYTLDLVEGKLTVLDEKINVSSNISFPDGNANYTGLEQTNESAGIVNVTPGKNGAFAYVYSVEGGQTGTLSNGKPKSAGTYTVTATYTSKIETGSKAAVYTINKVDLTVTVTPGITKVYDGNATINLDTYTLGFSGFVNSETAQVDASGVSATYDSENVGEGKTITFAGSFAFASEDHAEEKNYNIVTTGITGTITKAAGTWVDPTPLNTTYSTGKTLADVTPPTKYAWVDETTEVGNASAAAKSFAATYTQDGNHEAATGNISVNVAKATTATVTGKVIYIAADETEEQRVDLSTIFTFNKDDVGEVTYALGTLTNTAEVLSGTPTLSGKTLTYQGNEKSSGSATYTVVITSENYTTPDYNTITFTATPIQRTVTWVVDGGSPAPTQTSVDDGGSITQPTAPTKDGYNFGGWYTDEDFETAASFPITATANTTLYAKWTIKTYTVTWTTNGGSPAPTQTSVNHGSNITAPGAMTKANYVFDAWYAEAGFTTKITFPVANVTENKTFYAKWVDVYTVTFSLNYDGASTPATATTNAEGKVTFPANPSRTGYTFAGWYDAATGGSAVSAAQVFTQNTTVYAQWTQGTIYQITFDATGGTVSPAVGTTGLDGKLTSLPSATRSGYTFNGWFTSSSGGTQVTANTTFSANATLYAQWTAVVVAPPTPSYTAYIVTFNPVGGTVDPTSGATGADTKLASLPTPTRAGYAFDGWFTSSTGGTEVTRNTTFSANTTVYAHWSVATYLVIFDGNGGSVSPLYGTTGTGGRLSSLPETGTKEGYTFAGWYTDEVGGTRVTTGTGFATGAVIYAHWTPVRYGITYNLNSGTATPANPAAYTIETPDFTLNNPTRIAYTFAGWTGSNGTVKQTSVTIAQGSTGAKSYTANWTSNTYTITFNISGGTVSPTTAKTVEGGKLSSLPKPTARTGYDFDGWYTAETGGTKVSTSTVFGADATVYGRWTPTRYTLTYNLNGGTVTPANPATYTIETAGLVLNNPTRIAYTFAGWTGANGTVKQTEVSIAQGSTGNKTYTANWTLNNYTITFDANGGAVSPTSGRTGNGGKLTSLPNPTRADYAFDGWYTASSGGTKVTTSTVFGQETTIYAQWATVYTVSFDANGGSVSVASAKTGAGGKLSSLPTPTRSGYTFDGWYTDRTGGSRVTTSTVFSGSDNLYAHWSVYNGVAAADREIPVDAVVIEDAAVAPVRAVSGGVAVGPNPVRAGSEVSIYLAGGKAVSGKLGVFDALGARVAVIKVGGAKKIGTWKAVGVAEGTYLLKGVLTDKDGVKIKVSTPVAVVK